MNGMSAYVCIGKYGGFKIVRDAGIRITLGWIGVAVMLFDIEEAMLSILKHQRQLEKQLDNHRLHVDRASCPAHDEGQTAPGQ